MAAVSAISGLLLGMLLMAMLTIASDCARREEAWRAKEG
jgi:hypothetical protein